MKSLSGHEGRAQTEFMNLLRRRRLSKNFPEMDRIIQHPSKRDIDFLHGTLRNEAEYSNVCETNKWISGEQARIERDAQDDQYQERQAYHSAEHAQFETDAAAIRTLSHSSRRFIGIVWASSGCQRDRSIDWALIKLFETDGAPMNGLKANPLSSRNEDPPFASIKNQRGSSRFPVCKRRRTSDYTSGYAKGLSSHIRDQDTSYKANCILPTLQYHAFSMTGDSGSWIMDRDNQVVGMLWGGVDGEAPRTYFTDVRDLFKWIGEAYVKAMEMRSIKLPEYQFARDLVLLA